MFNGAVFFMMPVTLMNSQCSSFLTGGFERRHATYSARRVFILSGLEKRRGLPWMKRHKRAEDAVPRNGFRFRSLVCRWFSHGVLCVSSGVFLLKRGMWRECIPTVLFDGEHNTVQSRRPDSPFFDSFTTYLWRVPLNWFSRTLWRTKASRSLGLNEQTLWRHRFDWIGVTLSFRSAALYIAQIPSLTPSLETTM